MRARIFSPGTHGVAASLGLLAFRVAVGLMMAVGHGWEKLVGFGERSAKFPDPLGIGSTLSLAGTTGSGVLLRPPRRPRARNPVRDPPRRVHDGGRGVPPSRRRSMAAQGTRGPVPCLLPASRLHRRRSLLPRRPSRGEAAPLTPATSRRCRSRRRSGTRRSRSRARNRPAG
jgi:hypothetical protein